jgi:LmbE family N-acetylglucosaminyl deacetylase
MNVLLIAAHPDDEVLGCGGTASRLASEGNDIFIIILGEGITSRYAKREDADAALMRLHHGRAQKAGKLLGAREVKVLGLPDQRFDTVPLLEITHLLEEEVRRVRPEIVFTHHGGDLNMDHVITFRATLTATRPTDECPVRRLYAYEIPSSTDWSFQCFSPPFRPTAFFDITRFLDRKLAAMQMYESEVRRFPHPRSPETLRALAQRWGSFVGLESAEAFEMLREIR